MVLTTNLYGQFQVLSLATGALLYSYQTGSYIGSAPAVVDRNILFTSADGFLYDFALGGATSGSPTTAVTSPTPNSTIANPGQLTISGTASAPAGVSQVQVLVQEDGQSGTWWSAANGSWEAGPFNNPATLASPGATSTTWSLTVPLPARGTIFEVWSSAVDANGIADIGSDGSAPTPSHETFTVLPSTTAPTRAVQRATGGPRGGLTVTGGGYQPGEEVTIDLVTSPVTQLAEVVATAQGAIPADPGDHSRLRRLRADGPDRTGPDLGQHRQHPGDRLQQLEPVRRHGVPDRDRDKRQLHHHQRGRRRPLLLRPAVQLPGRRPDQHQSGGR